MRARTARRWGSSMVSVISETDILPLPRLGHVGPHFCFSYVTSNRVLFGRCVANPSGGDVRFSDWGGRAPHPHTRSMLESRRLCMHVQ